MAIDKFLVNGLGGLAGFGEQILDVGDDNSSAPIDITSVFPQGLNFLGASYTQVYVNNNGNLTFTGQWGGTSGTIGAIFPQLAPFWSDVDTRGGTNLSETPGGNSTGSNRVYWDLDTVKDVLTVTWDDVGQVNSQIDPLNAFQVQLVRVSGGFDIIFRYESINWVRDGASAGVAIADHQFVSLPDSPDALLALDATPGNTGITGVYQFGVRTGNGGSNTLSGGAGDDFIDGRGGHDTLNGGAGDDTLQGGSGNDTLNGGQGNDTASYSNASAAVTVSLALSGAQNTLGAGIDTLTSIENLTGSNFNDALTGNASNNVLEGGTGNDTLKGGDGIDTASYANATAAVTVSLALAGAQDTVGAGIDTLISIENLTGSAFDDVLTGNASKNVLDGGDGDDAMSGGGGNDTYIVSGSDDVMVENSGGGNDTCVITVSLNYSLTDEGLEFMENITFTAAAGGVGGFGNDRNNIATLNDASNYFEGLGGTDRLDGRGASDQLYGGMGDDFVSGGSGNDDLWGGGSDTDSDSADGDDELDGGTGADKMWGGNGNDIYYVDSASDMVFEEATVGTLSVLTDGAQSAAAIGDLADIVKAAVSYSLDYAQAAGVEDLTLVAGKAAALNATGNALANVLTGNSLANRLSGLGGDDTLTGGNGNDRLNGGDGADTASYTGASKGVTVNLALDNAQDTLGAGRDTLTFVENLSGSGRGDTLTGNGGANTLSGGDGNDILLGGGGNDTFFGGAGDDLLRGQSGADVLAGGRGADRFDYNNVSESGASEDACDTIDNFDRSHGDKIDLSDIDAKAGVSGNNKFTFIGENDFSDTDARGQLRFDAVNHLLLGSTDEDAGAEFSILLPSLDSMAAGDFVL